MTLPHRTVVVRLLALLLGALPWLGWAQTAPGGGGSPQGGGGATVYRCGPGQYSSEPCPGGVKLDTPAPPSAEQQRLARDAAARDAQLARQMAEERKAREREAARQAASSLGPKAAASAPAAPEKKAAKPKKEKASAKARKARAKDQPADQPRAGHKAKKKA